MRRSTIRNLTAATAAWLLLTGAAASARTPTPPPTASRLAPPPSVHAKNISNHKLDETAAAIQKVMQVRRIYQKRLGTASTANRKRILDEGNRAVKKAVTDQGLSVAEYNSIVRRAQTDHALRQKLLNRLKTKPGNAPKK